MGSVIRLRRGAGGPPGYDNDPWWLRQEHQAATMSGQLRVLGKERKTPGSGTMWRAAVPAEQRRLITSTLDIAAGACALCVAVASRALSGLLNGGRGTQRQ
jgi:hypothetical protein